MSIITALGLDTRDLKRGQQEYNATFRNMASTAKTSMAGIAGALGIGLGAAGAVQFLRQTAGELDAIGKAARQAGLSVEDYQVLAEAFRMGAGSAEELGMAITKVQQLMGMAARGDERATGVLGRMGVDFRDLQGLTPDRLLQMIAQRIKQIKDENERTTATVEIFGEKGKKVVDVLADGLSNLKNEMEMTGRLFDAESIKAAENYSDAIDKLNLSFKALAVNMGVVKAMNWVAETVEGASHLPGEVNSAQKQGASGMYTGWLEQASLVGLDWITLGQYSRLTEKYGPTTPLISVPAEGGDLVDQHQLNNLLDPGGEERKRKKLEEKTFIADKRYLEPLKREALANAEVEKALKPLKFAREQEAQAAKDQIEEGKLLPEIYKAVAKTGYQLTDQEKETIKNRVRLAYETRRAQEAQEKFSKSLKESLAPMREQMLTRLGMGRMAEQERALRELEKAKGRPLTVEEQQQAAKLGDLRYGINQLGQNRQVFDTGIQSNDLSSLGGWYSAVVMPDTDSISANILTEAQQMRTVLEEIQTLVANIKFVGG